MTRSGGRSLLEIGCGTGLYLRTAAQAAPDLVGIAVDVSERAVALTIDLQKWGLSDRFDVRHADITAAGQELSGRYDLITLLNNVYYFPVRESSKLLAALRRRLAPGGRLILVSLFKGTSVASADLDVVLLSTEGNWALPERTELTAALAVAGFGPPTFHRLVPAEPLYGVVAKIH